MKASEESKEKVLFFLDALNNEDYDAAIECLNPDFKFKGPLGKTRGAEKYLKQMKKKKFKYSIEKVFAHDDEVSVIYDIEMGYKEEITTCGLYRFKNGRLSSLKVFFDPRPVLQNSRLRLPISNLYPQDEYYQIKKIFINFKYNIMIHGIEEREQLARLHDRHKRLSLEVFDRINTDSDKDLIKERKKKLEETTKELEVLMIKLYANTI